MVLFTGLGFGLIYLPAIVCVAQYFEKKRSFATGLAVCGSGFGTFILAPLTELLVHEFSWRGAMLILGGIILNIVVCGIIFRPLESGVASQTKHRSEPEGDALLSDAELQSSRSGRNVISVEEIEYSRGNQLDKGQGEKLLSSAETYEIISSLQQLNALPCSKTMLASQNQQSPLRSLEITEKTGSSEISPVDLQEIKSSNDSEEKNKTLQLSASQCLAASEPYENIASFACSDGALHKHAVPQSGQQNAAKVHKRRSQRSSESSHGSSAALAPLHRKDIFYSGSLQNIPMYRSQPDVYKATVMGAPVPDHEVDGVSKKGGKKGGAFSDLCQEFHSTMNDMLSVALLKNPVFLMFAFSNFFTSIGFNMPFIFLPDR